MIGLGQARRMGPHVVSDDDGVFHLHALVGIQLPIALEELGGRMPDLPRGFFIEGVRISRANIVGFENFINHISVTPINGRVV